MHKNPQIPGLLALALAGVCAAQTPCIATKYSEIAPCVGSSTDIILKDVYAPSNSAIDLRKLKAGTTVTFAGKTTFGFTNDSSFEPILIGGSGITITGEPDAIIDGNGQAYWDGLGSNGGVPKPNHFIAASKLTGGSKGMHQNAASGKLAAAHNSDGIDLINSNNTIVRNISVWNQDDCVAITSGNNVTVDGLYCFGGHGLSIGSVGGKTYNNVTNIVFKNSKVVNSSNGARIKTNFNTTGVVSNITYSNIQLTNIDTYGIDVQQDYLNGGPTGEPSDGFPIENILFENVFGTVLPGGKNYYVLCGRESCKNFTFSGVKITGGKSESSCNYPETGCPA
ncbi:hypothetical protein DID88_002484 [Monilinia fructigena]|uniref:endo-polygalacturonase n=1 Tax=Monilinia fructigena TaxID=38457 RepID=A0A395INV4_9HELO|nr:hypothetical protein DID88_002484 [Monilinia fructigena]